jgi:hypothetical protein
MAAGLRTTYATLSQVVVGSDRHKTYTPGGIWVEFKPSSPSAYEEDRVSHLLETDYHPDITTNTILTLDDGRVLYVRGITDQQNRHVTHTLICDEVRTP